MSDRVITIDVVDALRNPIPNAKVIAGGSVTQRTGANGRATFTTPESGDIEIEAHLLIGRTLLYGRSDENYTFIADQLVIREPSFLERRFGVFIGIFFLIVSIVLTFAFPNAFGLQVLVIWATLSISLSAIASEITGFLNVNLSIGKKSGITAAGALGVFIVLFVVHPSLPEKVVSPGQYQETSH